MDHILFWTSSADWVLSSRLALRFRGMLLEPRLHLAEGLEGLAQLRLIDGVDIVILDSAMARRRGRTAVDAHLSTSESGCLLRHGLACWIVVGPGHRSLLPPRRLPPFRLVRVPTIWQVRNSANTDWR